MNNSPYITELLINEKLAASRAEGIRSQMQAREGLPLAEQQIVRAVFHWIQLLVASFNRRVEQPTTQKARVSYRGRMVARARWTAKLHRVDSQISK